MLLRLLCVGRRAKDPLLDAADDYLGRLARYGRVELIRLRGRGRADEAEDFLDRMGQRRPDHRTIAFDERGKHLSSIELSQALRGAERQRVQRLDLLIGGDDGFDPRVLERVDERWALSRLTLPHRLALVLACEQLYRAQTILRGEDYHRDG